MSPRRSAPCARFCLAGCISFPHTTDKEDPLTISEETFVRVIGSTPAPVQKALPESHRHQPHHRYGKSAIWPPLTRERPLRQRAFPCRADPLIPHVRHFDGGCQNRQVHLNIIYRGEEPVEFASVPLTCYESAGIRQSRLNPSAALLDSYYSEKALSTRIRQKSVDLPKSCGPR